VRIPLAVVLPEKNQNHVLTQTGNLRLDLCLRSIADSDHRDHSSDANDNTERSQD